MQTPLGGSYEKRHPCGREVGLKISQYEIQDTKMGFPILIHTRICLFGLKPWSQGCALRLKGGIDLDRSGSGVQSLRRLLEGVWSAKGTVGAFSGGSS